MLLLGTFILGSQLWLFMWRPVNGEGINVAMGYLLTLVLSTFIESRLLVLLQVQFGWTELTLCAMFFALSSLMGLIPALRGFSVKS